MKKTITGIGVSGGVGDGILRRWSGKHDSSYSENVVVLSDLDATVAQAAIAKAIISCSGSITSHGAILARELEVPCVVVEDAKVLERLYGSLVHVDGWNGLIEYSLLSENETD